MNLNKSYLQSKKRKRIREYKLRLKKKAVSK